MTYNLETKRRGSLPNCAVQLGGQSAGLNVINKYVWVSTHKSLRTCCFSVYQQRKKKLVALQTLRLPAKPCQSHTQKSPAATEFYYILSWNGNRKGSHNLTLSKKTKFI